MKKKKTKKKGIICKIMFATLVVTGAGLLAYKKIPEFKKIIDGVLPSKKAVPEIKTKPFRKYETFKKR